MSGAGRRTAAQLSRALRAYCAFYLALFALGVVWSADAFWRRLVALMTWLAEPLLLPEVLFPLLLAGVAAPVAIALFARRRGLRARAVLGPLALALVAFPLHFLPAIGAASAPRTAGGLALAALAAALLVRRRGVVALARGPALRLTAVQFAALSAVGAVAFVSAMNPSTGAAPESPGVRLLGTFSSPYGVAVLGDTGRIAVMSAGDFSVHLVARASGAIEGSVRFPEGVRPQRAAYDPDSRRLFVIGHDLGNRDDVAVAVIATGPFTLERWLPMPGCRNAIHVAIWPSPAEVVALCEPQPLLFFYDLRDLAAMRIEEVAPSRGFTGYALARLGEQVVVSAPPWPSLFLGPRSGEGPWRRRRLASMAWGLAADPRGQRVYLARPLEGAVDALDAGAAEPSLRLRTSGMPRELALDGERGWLFAGSYFRGVVDQFDTRGARRLRSWRVGTLLRGVTWDAAASRLYTASIRGVHEIAVE